MDTKYIAQTILDQIKHGRVPGCQNGLHAMMCWAAHQYIMLPQNATEGFLGGLQFMVSGAVLKGKVRVWLHASDTYTLHFINRRGDIVNTITDVYFEDLAQIIDREVESGK
jgi:hypothetical protein